jgi:CO/xanthine dehydrogenase Mo-binding subunit
MKKRGCGMACMWYPVGFTVSANPSAATVKVNEDGTALVVNGTVETGQGSQTVLAQIAAEELGIAPDDVTMVTADTDSAPMDTGPIASRTTYVTGNAIRLAAAQARQILFEAAAPLLGVPADQLEATGRRIQVKGFAQKYLAIGDVAFHSQVKLGRPAVGTASFNPATVALDPKTGQGKPFSTYVYAAQVAEVEVDTETGWVDVLRVVAAHDCGRVINPMLVEGQIEGGVATGIGYALFEEIVFRDGAQSNPSFADYVLPTTMDVPPIEVVLVEKYDPTGPFGAKGVGEPTLVPTAAAILNAIQDAVGVRIYSLPATPEKVLRALQEKQAQESSPAD